MTRDSRDVRHCLNSTFIATIHSVEWATDSGGSYPDVPEHGAFSVADVSIQGISGSTHYNPFGRTVRDAEGRSYQIAIFGAKDPGLHDRYAEPGHVARGYVAFDVPQGAVTIILGSRPGIRWAVPE